MENEQVFWDAYRPAMRKRMALWDVRASGKRGRKRTDAWTELMIESAIEACERYACHYGRSLIVTPEVTYRCYRIDVLATDRQTGEFVVAFESELAYWGYRGGTKDWREEFSKLCAIKAELRVLSSTFRPLTGPQFPAFLRERLDSMREHFVNGEQGGFCLGYGPEDSTKDREHPWLAYSLERDFTLRPLVAAVPLRQRRVIEGVEPSLEN
jgi:hypothetical protein